VHGLNYLETLSFVVEIKYTFIFPIFPMLIRFNKIPNSVLLPIIKMRILCACNSFLIEEISESVDVGVHCRIEMWWLV